MRMVLYQSKDSTDSFNQFHKALMERDLVFSSLDLIKYGLDPIKDLAPAIRRAINTCVMEQLPISQHFQAVFIDRHGQLIKGWRLSATALRLVLINANPDNPLISKIQMEMVQNN